jgi:hypothetical protein
LTGTAASFTWDNDTTGYASGSTGSPITPTSTGNETIFVNIANGTVTINVADGVPVPSIRSAGATVNVVAGQKTLTIKVIDAVTKSPIQNSRVYVTADAGGPLAQGTVLIDKVSRLVGWCETQAPARSIKLELLMGPSAQQQTRR